MRAVGEVYDYLVRRTVYQQRSGKGLRANGGFSFPARKNYSVIHFFITSLSVGNLRARCGICCSRRRACAALSSFPFSCRFFRPRNGSSVKLTDRAFFLLAACDDFYHLSFHSPFFIRYKDALNTPFPQSCRNNFSISGFLHPISRSLNGETSLSAGCYAEHFLDIAKALPT